MRTNQKTKDKTVEDLLLKNYNQYYRLAYSYVHNDADAGDIVQNGAYKAIKNSCSLNNIEYAATWLYRIMLNEIFSFCKQRKHESLDEVTSEIQTEDNYENLDLKHALELLPEEEQILLKLKFFEEMKLEDIAVLMYENVNTVKSRIYRSLKKLKLQLKDDWVFS
ncbi:MAG: sigma-70 family RNA polymerase sigma factor [Roseburia sp.]|nr:sigma-70 family RNA polymerase sigma factor [Roseburia sp.]